MERQLILTRLLEKYENSAHLRNPGKSSRRVMLQILRNDLPEYTFETAGVRDRFNDAVRKLESEKLVKAEWLSDRPVIKVIALNLDSGQIKNAYQAADRIHPVKAAEDFSVIVENALSDVKTPWICSWRDDVIEKTRETLQLPSVCKQGDSFARDFVKLLAYYDSLNGTAVTTRAFSTACFQNSKRFEQEFQSIFIREAKRYDTEVAELSGQKEFGAREVLALMGIYSHPELYQLSGRCRIITRSGAVDLSPLFPFGIAIHGSAVDDIDSFDTDGIQKVIFIENLTNYNEFLRTEISPNEMVIYHGGFFSPKKRVLLQRLSESLSPETGICFWGDIDLGGFQMYYRLREIFPLLTPLRMSAEDVVRYSRSGLKRDTQYLQELQEALYRGEYQLFSEAIRMILKYGVSIEQETFL